MFFNCHSAFQTELVSCGCVDDRRCPNVVSLSGSPSLQEKVEQCLEDGVRLPMLDLKELEVENARLQEQQATTTEVRHRMHTNAGMHADTHKDTHTLNAKVKPHLVYQQQPNCLVNYTVIPNWQKVLTFSSLVSSFDIC